MTLDSAIVTKDFGNPSIVRPRPINIQMGADGETSTDDSKSETQKKGGVVMLVGFALLAYVVYKLIESK